MDIHIMFLIKNLKKTRKGLLCLRYEMKVAGETSGALSGVVLISRHGTLSNTFRNHRVWRIYFLGDCTSLTLPLKSPLFTKWDKSSMNDWKCGMVTLLFYRTVLPKLYLRIILKIQYPQQRWNTMSSEALKPSCYWTVWIKETLMKLDGKSSLLMQTT